MAAARAAHDPCGHGGWARSVRTRGARGTTGLANHGHEGHMSASCTFFSVLLYCLLWAFYRCAGVPVRRNRLHVALAQ